jgi:Electron transfer DM13
LLIIFKANNMKYTLALLVSVLLFAACKKQNEASTTPGTDPIDTLAQTTLYTGNFIKGPWGTVTGRAKILRSFNGALTLALDSVVISNGPDLHVYLSKEVQPINFIDLGLLKSTSGNQVYAISGMPDFAQYKYALIHCQKYNHLFGSAELRP